MTECIALDGVGLGGSVHNWRFRQAWLERSTAPCEWWEILADCYKALLPLVLSLASISPQKIRVLLTLFCTMLNLTSNDILSIVLKVPSVLVDSSSFVWFSSLSSSLLSSLELSNFEKLSLFYRVFNHWTVKLPRFFLSNIQNCEWLTDTTTS